MVYREDDEVREYKQRTREAIDLAMESRWAEAAALNRELVKINPDDIQAWNRLGKAALELGEKKKAQSAFTTSLQLDPSNSIAKKNLDRLATIPETKTRTVQGAPLTSKMFIGDSGKSARVALTNSIPPSERALISPGTQLTLQAQGGGLAVTTVDGLLLGMLPAKVGRRLVGLIAGGNEYQAAVAGTAADAIMIMIVETYQHPSQRSKTSFPHSTVGPETPAPKRVEEEANAVAEAAARELNMTFGQEAVEDIGLDNVTVGAALDGAALDDPLIPEIPEEESA